MILIPCYYKSSVFPCTPSIRRMVKLGPMVFYLFGHLVTFLVIWFSIYSVLQIQSNGPACITIRSYLSFYLFNTHGYFNIFYELPVLKIYLVLDCLMSNLPPHACSTAMPMLLKPSGFTSIVYGLSIQGKVLILGSLLVSVRVAKCPLQKPITKISPNQEPALELHSRAAPSVEAHHHINSPETGENSGGRQIKKLP